MFYKLLLLLGLALTLSCHKKMDTPTLEPLSNEDGQFHTLITTELQQHSIAGVELNYLEGESDLVIVANYDKNNPDLVAQLATLAQEWTPLVFTHPEVDTVLFYYLQGSEFFNLRHFMQIDRADYIAAQQENTLPKTPFDWYNLANRYYIGSSITGDLTFKLGDVDVLLPVQKPIN